MAILLAGFSQSLLAQTDYYWSNAAGGSWHTPGNWRTGTATGPFATVAPTRDDNVFINNSFPSAATITVMQASAAKNFTYSVTNRAVTLQIGALLEIAGSVSITNNTANAGAASKLSITTAPTATTAAITAGTVAIKFTAPLSANATIQSGGSNPTTYGAPVIFDSPGSKWTLQDNMTASNRVTFTNGHVVAIPAPDPRPSIDPVLRNSNTIPASPRFGINHTGTIVSSRNQSHVVGYFQMVDAGLGATLPTIPIGDGTYLRPMVLQSVTGGGAGSNIIFRYYNNYPTATVSPALTTNIHPTLGAGLNGVSTMEYWYVGREGGSANPKFVLDYNNTNPALPTNYYRIDKWQALTIAALHSNDNAWVLRTSVPSNPGSGSTTLTLDQALSSNFGWFTIARVGVSSLPVRLVSFTGQQLEGQVQLKWQSSSEENTSHFEVERSADGKNFSPVLTKKAQGNSSSLVSYNAIDNSPLSGTSYYRLKMVDLDGTFEYSKLVAVNAEGTLQVLAYPNPSQGNGINLIAGDGSKLVVKSVSDLFGKTVGYQQRNAGESLQVNFAQPLPAGFYVATLAGSDNGALVKVKFVVQ